jgi:hypothetical protein
LCIYLYTKTDKETQVNKQEDVHEETSTENTEDVSELESLSELEVEKEVFNVKIVLPADLVGDSTQEDLEEEAEKYGHKVTLNADGAATYIMTKRQHSKMMKDIKDEIEKNMSDMVGSDEFPNIVDVSSNSSFTEFKITTRNTQPDIAESFSVIGLYMQSGIYHTFNGTTVENIHVDFINADTKEIISSSDSSNLNE